MPLLNDQELVDLVLTKKIIEGLPDPPSLPNATAIEAWYGRDSAIQPSSIDLHIGDILVPNVTADAPGSVAKPKKDFTLQLGQMVVITSLEQLNLPDNIAAFGFPPARLSSRGLLMTNPGHVDPGFRGGLSFTVMNIGKADISLRKHDPIVTLLFFELKSAAKAGYATRYKLKPLSLERTRARRQLPLGQLRTR